MQFAYADSFHRTAKRLNRRQAESLLKAVQKFESLWESGQVPRGVGMTHLRGTFFEFRIDIHTRVLFRRDKGTILYLFYGSQDDIRNFLKRL